MEHEDLLEVDKLLDELSEYQYKQTKPRVERIREILKDDIDSARSKKYREESGLPEEEERDIVKEIINAQASLSNIKRINNNAYDEVGFHDKATGDLLHALELLSDGEEEILEYAVQLRETRKMRRKAKDTQEVLSPMISFIAQNSGVIKEFNRAVNQMVENKSKLNGRRYMPRVKTELEVAFEETLHKEEDNTNEDN